MKIYLILPLIVAGGFLSASSARSQQAQQTGLPEDPVNHCHTAYKFAPRYTINWDGACSNGMLSGPGTLTLRVNGRINSSFSGTFQNGSLPSGKYRDFFDDGTLREFQEGNFDGKGSLEGMGRDITLFFRDNAEFKVGEFHNDEFQSGILIWQKPSDFENWDAERQLELNMPIVRALQTEQFAGVTRMPRAREACKGHFRDDPDPKQPFSRYYGSTVCLRVSSLGSYEVQRGTGAAEDERPGSIEYYDETDRLIRRMQGTLNGSWLEGSGIVELLYSISSPLMPGYGTVGLSHRQEGVFRHGVLQKGKVTFYTSANFSGTWKSFEGDMPDIGDGSSTTGIYASSSGQRCSASAQRDRVRLSNVLNIEGYAQRLTVRPSCDSVFSEAYDSAPLKK